jgi:hypothetical protein
MKFDTYSICFQELKGICKSISAWGYNKKTNSNSPLIYFQKPKWMDKEDFEFLIKHIKITDLPVDYEFKEIK